MLRKSCGKTRVVRPALDAVLDVFDTKGYDIQRNDLKAAQRFATEIFIEKADIT
jgi:hypothetical protein